MKLTNDHSLLLALAACAAVALPSAPDAQKVVTGTQGGPAPHGRLPNWFLEHGLDFYQSEGQVRLNLPSGFFGPGSQPFFGQVPLQGEPIETAGAFELGTTDTVVRRLSDLELELPGQAEVGIQIVELHLVGIQPIQVVVNGQPEPWDVRVDLEGPGEIGAMQVVLDAPHQGSFDCVLPVQPILTFSRPGQPEIPLPLGGGELLGTGGFLLPPSSCGVELMMQGVVQTLGCGDIFTTSPALDVHLMPSNPLPIPPAFIDPGAFVDPQVTQIGRGAVISPGAEVHAGVIVGPGAFIGPNAILLPGAVIGANALIDENVVIGADARIGDLVQILSGSLIGAGGIVESNSFVSPGAAIGNGSRIGSNGFVGTGATVGNQVGGGRGLAIGDFAIVADGLILTDGAQVLAGANLQQPILPCHAGGLDFPSTPEDCPGAVRATIFSADSEKIPTLDKEVEPFDQNDLPAELDDLVQDVDKAKVAAPKNGGEGKDYDEDDYDCDDYAHDLEVALEVDYDATFTAIWEVNKDKEWWETEKYDLINGHALVDIHHAGRLIWIEAQFTGADGVGVDLDLDGDGKVGYAESSGITATESSADGSKCYRIEVYDSRADAAKNGVPID